VKLTTDSLDVCVNSLRRTIFLDCGRLGHDAMSCGWLPPHVQ
jgi:hypothetical protein